MTAFPDTRARQRAALDEITRHRPKMIVTVMDPVTFLASESTPEDLVIGLATMIDRGYHIAAVAPLLPLVDGVYAREELLSLLAQLKRLRERLDQDRG